MTDPDQRVPTPAAPTVVVDAQGKLHLQSAKPPRRLPETGTDGTYQPIKAPTAAPGGPTIRAVEPTPAVTPVQAAEPVPPVEPEAAMTSSDPVPPAPGDPPARRGPTPVVSVTVTPSGRSPRHHASDPTPRQRGGRDRHRLRKHFGGWIRSIPDPARLVADTFGIPLRTEVDPRSELPPIFDQGRLGSCTANAAAAAFEYDAKLDGNLTGPLSRLWIYYQERKLEGSLGDGDAGARGFDAFRIASRIGVPAETYWPYDISTFQGPPPERAIKDEGFYRLTKRYATPLPTRHSFKQVLSNRQTIAFGFLVYESFESSSVAKSGIVPMPRRGEQVLGGHEVLAVGYFKSEPDYVLCRNSWGSRRTDGHRWGIDGGGYFLMPWKMILNPAISGDWTTIVRPLRRH